MTDAHNAFDRLMPARLLFTSLRHAGWSDRLVLFLRVMAVCSLAKGLYHWATVCGFIGEPGGFEAHPPAWQATTVFFSVIDLVAAVGLWLVAPWGWWRSSAISSCRCWRHGRPRNKGMDAASANVRRGKKFCGCRP